MSAIGHVRAAIGRVEARFIPKALSTRWKPVPRDADESWRGRLARDRSEIIPWLARTAQLDGAKVIEVGAGHGASTFALAEQGVDVIAYDLDQRGLELAERLLAGAGLAAEFRCANAAALGELPAESAEWVIFWASLEHMTHDERIASIIGAWNSLRPNGLLTVIETPNRLWPHDSHTSQLPFFSWLPDELAFDTAHFSPRQGFGGDHYSDRSAQMLDFLRRGRGVSIHDFRVALGGSELEVVSCLQLERRRRNPIRRIGWAVGTPGRTVRCLRRYEPSLEPAWLQPFLYLTLRKPAQ